ncbi:MAG: hypothetical protein E6Z12_02705 [Finegoldia magna]|nr:hypothetical protein [Finegoldia magna]
MDLQQFFKENLVANVLALVALLYNIINGYRIRRRNEKNIEDDKKFEKFKENNRKQWAEISNQIKMIQFNSPFYHSFN